jgi:hypothetical protein
MRKKRFGKPRAKKDELKCQWGKLHGREEMIYSWGALSGLTDRDGGNDAAFLHVIFNVKRFDSGTENPLPSFVEELEARGYDITTFKFSIQKKKI